MGSITNDERDFLDEGYNCENFDLMSRHQRREQLLQKLRRRLRREGDIGLALCDESQPLTSPATVSQFTVPRQSRGDLGTRIPSNDALDTGILNILSSVTSSIHGSRNEGNYHHVARTAASIEDVDVDSCEDEYLEAEVGNLCSFDQARGETLQTHWLGTVAT
jgi:hypothetical protein